MKKLFPILLLSALSFSTYAENLLSVENFSVEKGQTNKALSIYLTNEDEENLDAITFSIILPQGMTFYSTTDRRGNKTYPFETSDRAKNGEDGNSWSIFAPNENSMNVAFVNTNQYGILETSGEIITFYITTSDDYKGGIIEFKEVSGGREAKTVDLFGKNYTATIIGKGGMSSFSSEASVKVEGATAYYGVIDDDKNAFVLTAFDENIVPANTGAVLIGEEGTAVSLSSAASNASNLENDLQPSVSRKEVTANSTYVIATGEEGTGFYPYSGTAIPAGKAYLKAPGYSGAPLRVISNATGIEELESNNNAVEVYSLFGNKTENRNGQVIIENGKKIIRH